MTVKPHGLRKVDGRVGTVINSLLSVCRYYVGISLTAFFKELLGVPRARSITGTALSSQ